MKNLCELIKLEEVKKMLEGSELILIKDYQTYLTSGFQYEALIEMGYEENPPHQILYSKEQVETAIETLKEGFRICSCCGDKIQQGFVVADGEDYYCCKEKKDCLDKEISKEEQKRLYGEEDDEETCSLYWTEWSTPIKKRPYYKRVREETTCHYCGEKTEKSEDSMEIYDGRMFYYYHLRCVNPAIDRNLERIEKNSRKIKAKKLREC